MANNLLLKGTQIDCPTSRGAASTFSSATLVRLVNTGTTVRLVTLVEEASGTVVGTFSLPGGEVEYLEKVASYAIFAASNEVKGAAFGYTN